MLLRRCLVLLALLSLAGCGGDDEPQSPASYPALQFGYLTKLRLNVGAIDIRDQSAPTGDADLSAQSPAVPAQALQQMARDRLFAAGTDGTGVFVIDQASITREPTGSFDGALVVHLDIRSGAGTIARHAQAEVTRQHIPGSDSENQASVLYDLTRQMMADMNVELEFQLRRSLKPWLADGYVPPAPVQAQPLPGTPLPAAPAPDAATPPAPDQPSPPEMSPPPGFLQLPPGQTQ